jgi:hypothetical protein
MSTVTLPIGLTAVEHLLPVSLPGIILLTSDLTPAISWRRLVGVLFGSAMASATKREDTVLMVGSLVSGSSVRQRSSYIASGD